MSALPILGYWDIRGNTEPIRMLLHFAKSPFNDKRYQYGPADNPRGPWLADKFNLGLDFPNLPYYIDGDLKLTQSLAIFHHVARKHNLVGKTEAEQARLEMLEQQVIDVRGALISICYNEKFEELKPDLVKSIPERMKLLSDYLGERQFAAGDHVTYVDFLLYDVLDIYKIFEASALQPFANLQKYVERVEQLPGVAEYMSSGTYHKLPFTGAIAKWGNVRQ